MAIKIEITKIIKVIRDSKIKVKNEACSIISEREVQNSGDAIKPLKSYINLIAANYITMWFFSTRMCPSSQRSTETNIFSH